MEWLTDTMRGILQIDLSNESLYNAPKLEVSAVKRNILQYYNNVGQDCRQISYCADDTVLI